MINILTNHSKLKTSEKGIFTAYSASKASVYHKKIQLLTFIWPKSK